MPSSRRRSTSATMREGSQPCSLPSTIHALQPLHCAGRKRTGNNRSTPSSRDAGQFSLIPTRGPATRLSRPRSSTLPQRFTRRAPSCQRLKRGGLTHGVRRPASEVPTGRAWASPSPGDSAPLPASDCDRCPDEAPTCGRSTAGRTPSNGVSIVAGRLPLRFARLPSERLTSLRGSVLLPAELDLCGRDPLAGLSMGFHCDEAHAPCAQARHVHACHPVRPLNLKIEGAARPRAGKPCSATLCTDIGADIARALDLKINADATRENSLRTAGAIHALRMMPVMPPFSAISARSSTG